MTNFQFYSQHFQDVFLFRNLLNTKVSDGIFVELGGLDGITMSNSKFFEDELNYSGVLIEPLPDLFQKMKENRPNCQCFNYAVDLQNGTSEFIIPNNLHAMAGNKSKMPSEYINMNNKNNQEITVKTKPINEILKMANIEYIDLFSIDVEGGEYEVLQSMDWNIPIYIICIELDGLNKEKDNKCIELLKFNNFTLKFILGMNQFWINENYTKKERLFMKNPNQHPFEPIINGINSDGHHKQFHKLFSELCSSAISKYEKDNFC